MSVRENILKLNGDIARKLESIGRSSDDSQLVLVTKTVDLERIQEAYLAGARHLGENRVQEWMSKVNELPADVFWHIIGHLQVNKIKYLIPFLAQYPRRLLLHSLDRAELALEIEKQARKKGISEFPCLIQVNTSHEVSKGGFAPHEVSGFLKSLPSDTVLKIKGLMTIGPLTEDQSQIRESFRQLKNLRDELKKESPNFQWDYLSMGMSADYEIALEEGSNMLRIGSVIFGHRPPKESL